MKKFGEFVGGLNPYNLYEQVKQRNTGEVVDPRACKKMVYTFVKGGQFDGPGDRCGPCGVKKDHHRVYCCQNCYHHWN